MRDHTDTKFRGGGVTSQQRRMKRRSARHAGVGGSGERNSHSPPAPVYAVGWTSELDHRRCCKKRKESFSQRRSQNFFSRLRTVLFLRDRKMPKRSPFDSHTKKSGSQSYF